MQNLIRTIAVRLRQLRDDIAGLALIEFAYTLPVMLGFGLIGIEYTNVILAHQKTERIASTLSDQIAGNQVPPNERQIGDMFDAVQLIANPFEFGANGGVVVTAVVGIYDDDDDRMRNKIAWQRCSNSDAFESDFGTQWTGSNDVADGPNITLPRDIQLAQNQMVIITEVFFPYEEIINEDFVVGMLPASGTFEQTAIFRTRGQALMDITPVQGVAEHSCSG
jgi:Flp pilus assembly protein TadG